MNVLLRHMHRGLIWLLLAILTPPLHFLLGGRAYGAEFNPNYLISDEELQAWKSMNQSEIQTFLDNRGGFIAHHTFSGMDGQKTRASEIIWQASQEHRINPKYLLVKLQKEQSLVTDPDPTQRQLDYATGYGVCDSCSFSDPDVIKHSGFANQVDSAAAIMRWYYDHVNSESWIKRANQSYAIDGTEVIPANLATAFLYTYTPHIHGNKNFWNLWQQWFDQVYPDGTLLKAETDPNVYVLKDRKKRLIMSMSVLTSRFDPKRIITVPASELARYETGTPLRFANYSILQQDATFYLVTGDTVRPFASQEVLRKLGYNPAEIQQATTDDLSAYGTGTAITADEQYPEGRLVQVGDKGQLYHVQGNQYSPVVHPAIAASHFPNLVIEQASPAEFADKTRGEALLFADGVLIGDMETGYIYAVENGKRKHITSEKVFEGLGYRWDTVLWVDTFTIALHKPAEPIYLRSESPAVNEQSTQKIPATVPQAAKSEASETVQYRIPRAGENLPISITENGKMLATPAEHVTYTGEEKYATDIDSYIVADYANGEILAAKNPDVVRPMASLAKVMTAYRLFAEGLNIERNTVYKKDQHTASYHAYRITNGEAVKNNDLMKAMLVTSRNTPARMLVSAVTDSESRFISRMNAQAANWGLEQTHFTDSYGYDLGNQTTARDYARLAQKVLADERIRNYLNIASFSYNEAFDLDSKPFHAGSHTNSLVGRTDLGFTILASKTGFLNEAGYNIMMLVKRDSDGKRFILITLGDPDYADRIENARAFADWALAQY